MPIEVGVGGVDQPTTATTSQDQPGPSIPQVVSRDKHVVVTLPQFLKLKLPTFIGASEQEDPQKFLKGVERACRSLKCYGEQFVEFVSYQL